MRQNGASHVDEAVQVDVELRFDVAVGCQVFVPAKTAKTGVVDQNVNLAIMRQRRFHQALDASELADVGLDRQSLPALGADFVCQGLQASEAARRQHDAIALVGEQARGGFADAWIPSTAGNCTCISAANPPGNSFRTSALSPEISTPATYPT